VGENTNQDDRSPLLPDRYPQQDFFVCDIFDAAPKGDMASMEHPIFSVATKPDFNKRAYEHGDAILRVTPSGNGLATVHDRDVLIYCISQIMGALNQGKKVSQVVRFKAYDLLVATNRGTDGRGYEQLKAAFKRLQGTQIETNITTGGETQWDVFSLVDRASIIRESFDGRMIDVEVKLSDWVFNAIKANEVLTLNRRYFRLRKPLERRLYEIARKHCGWPGKPVTFGLDTIQKKCGSQSTAKEFKRLLKTIAAQDAQHSHFPDYALTLDDAKDQVTFSPRRKALEATNDAERPMITDRGREGGRRYAPGYDIYALESDFMAFWHGSGCKPLKSADAAFIGFCKQRAKRNPMR
jgi:plasmid replication initiation protein